LYNRYARGESGGKWTLAGEIFGEQFEDQFWERPRKYNEFFN
jgi:hypothetical protein